MGALHELWERECVVPSLLSQPPLLKQEEVIEGRPAYRSNNGWSMALPAPEASLGVQVLREAVVENFTRHIIQTRRSKVRRRSTNGVPTTTTKWSR